VKDKYTIIGQYNEDKMLLVELNGKYGHVDIPKRIILTSYIHLPKITIKKLTLFTKNIIFSIKKH
jgi:hypothetical protein